MNVRRCLPVGWKACFVHAVVHGAACGFKLGFMQSHGASRDVVILHLFFGVVI